MDHRRPANTSRRRNPPSWISYHRSTPDNAQASSRRLGRTTAQPPATSSPSNQRQTVASRHGPSHPYSRPSLPLSRLHQDVRLDMSVATDRCNTQNTTIQQGAFTNAHNFTIGVAYMNDHRRAEKDGQTEEERQAAKALKELAAKGMPGAMLNSRERTYAPRCNEDTRQTVRARILEWAQNVTHTRRLLWLFGPAAVGKSAVAQTVAEQLKKVGILGAAFFFSRPNGRSDPDVVVPTLVNQLVLLLPGYQQIVIQKLVKDPLILSKDRRSLFEDLIVGPLRILASQDQTTVPLVIVIDGLDECHDRQAQCELVEMISHCAHSEINLCLRWIICSRPEPNLKVAFSSQDCRTICFKESLEVDDSEAQKDANRILVRGFAEIKKAYPDQLTQDWPTRDQVDFIATRASGHLGFASFIIRFICDKDYDDPSGQLDVCLEFLRHTNGSTDISPLHALDLLYTQILSDVHPNILPTTRHILGLFIFYGNKHLTAIAHANFLGLTQAAFYRALQRLHSVLVVPSVSDAGEKPIQMYHASFSDYLKDPARSGKFFLDEAVVPPLEIALSGLKWLRHGQKNPSDPAGHGVQDLTWIPSTTFRGAVLDSLCRFSFTPCWRACRHMSIESLETLMEMLADFDFDLDYTKWWTNETRDFAYFIRWLASLGTSNTPLTIINCGALGNGRLTNRGRISVYHQDDDPHDFIIPFFAGAPVAYTNYHTIYFELGRSKPILFILKVGTSWPHRTFKT